MTVATAVLIIMWAIFLALFVLGVYIVNYKPASGATTEGRIIRFFVGGLIIWGSLIWAGITMVVRWGMNGHV